MQPYKQNIEDVCKTFETNIDEGLTQYEAKKRLEKYGLNQIKEGKAKSPLIILLQQFLSPLMYILLIAAVASIIIGEMSDAVVIGIAVAINTIIGFLQEWKAEKAAVALKAYEVAHCRVRRDDKIFSIKASELVPGDVVLLDAGSRVPADVRLFYAVDFTVEEAILTGESRAIIKNIEPLTKDLSLGDRTNMAYSGTYAIEGKAEGIVVATGEQTELGRIAQLIIETKEEKTPLQIQIQKFSWFLGWLMLAITGGVLLLGIIKQLPIKEIVTISIALAVAAIPEGLLVAVTVVLAIGMQRMLKRKALVRHLIAAETLGSVSVICTDKTGTLTEGIMAVSEIVSAESDKALLEMGVLNNDAQILEGQRIGNPTEVALLQAAKDTKINLPQLKKENPRVYEIPFSSDLKYMATLHKEAPNKFKLIVKGAPERIF
jgi:Ca2+-transporting ATPase